MSAKAEPTRKRKLWTQSDESMIAAVKSVEDGKGLREASRLYNIPVETIRRRIIDCWPGPATVLTEEELYRYLIQMSYLGFGLSVEDVMCMAYNIAEKITESTRSRMVKLDVGGLMGLRHTTPNLPYAHHNHCHIAALYAQTRKPSMISLES